MNKIIKVLDDQQMMSSIFSGGFGGACLTSLFVTGYFLIIGGVIGASVCAYAEYKSRK